MRVTDFRDAGPSLSSILAIAPLTAALMFFVTASAFGAISLPAGPVHVMLQQGSKTIVDTWAPVPAGFKFDGTEAIDLNTTTPDGQSKIILKIHIVSPDEDLTVVHFYLRSVDDVNDPNGIGTGSLLDSNLPIDYGRVTFGVEGLDFSPNPVGTFLVDTEDAATFYMLLDLGPRGSFIALPQGRGFSTGVPGEAMWQVPMSAFVDSDAGNYNFLGNVNVSPSAIWSAVPNPIDAGFGIVDVATATQLTDPYSGHRVVEIGAAAFYAVIPEPATLGLLAIPLALVVARRYKTKPH